MASNSFGKIFRITTWGESHGKAMGVVIDGCPAGIEINAEEINQELSFRAPGKNSFTSPRKEPDQAEIYSGVFEGQTTGAPISLIIPNKDVDSSKYDEIKKLLRPGHANHSYLAKYGVFDHRGGGRASARETVCRVAAGAIAKKFLRQHGITLLAYIREIGGIKANVDIEEFKHSPEAIRSSLLYCPDSCAAQQMLEMIENSKAQGDSLGGIVELYIHGIQAGLGEPVYDKLEATLASAFMSIPASKGVEIGAGFQAARMKGSTHNDAFVNVAGEVRTATNHAGGTLGGISTGMPLIARVAFKPTSSIAIEQDTIDVNGKGAKFQLPSGSRHDPCVAIRAVPVVEAMAALVLADALLCDRSSKA